MKKEKSKQILTPWLKGFLTSILGTTISIALTFGTTALVNNKKKQDAQRLTAMMVIDDIDKSIETVKKIRDYEEQGYNVSIYALEHLDSIETLTDDSLNIVFNYLLEGVSISSENEFSESTEKMFHSTQESWSNLSSVKFVRNIEDFYKDRKKLSELRNYAVWVKPVAETETSTVLMNSDILDTRENFCNYLKDVLKRRRCQKYLRTYIDRLKVYNQIIEGWTNQNDENKFLMNITDEELKEFVEKNTKLSHPASEKDIIGTWVSDAVDAHVTEYEFKQDNTFRNLQSYSLHKQNLAGKAYVEFTVFGKWHIEADSLIIVPDQTTVKANLNDSNIIYREELREAQQRELREYVEAMLPSFRENLEKDGGRTARAISIDVTGNKLELTNPDKQTTHYKRKK